MYSLLLWRCFTIAKDNSTLVNEQIRANEVLVIGPNGEQLGIKSREDALTLANTAGFDLVQVGANPKNPVCKLMDYNKYKYEKQKKQKEALKKQRINANETKEFRLSVNIDIHDFNTRVNQVVKYLQKGHKIKATIRFRGREMAHTELGEAVLIRFSEAVKDYGEVEEKPKMEIRTMSMLIKPIKKEGEVNEKN